MFSTWQKLLLPLVLLLAWYSSRVDLGDFVRLVTTPAPAPADGDEASDGPDLRCMLTECSSETFQCLTDRSCLKGLACLAPCGDDQACTFRCLSQFENGVFQQFNQCVIGEKGCIKLNPPKNPHVCSKPEAVKTLSIEDSLRGRWFVAFGLNHIYDCFPCQVFNFIRNETKELVFMDYQVDLEDSPGQVRDKSVMEEVSQPDPKISGVLQLQGIQNGLAHEEEWRVLQVARDHVIAQYCGSMSTWVYEGMVVLVREERVAKDQRSNVSKSLKDLGLKMEEFCEPRIALCSNKSLR